MVKKDKYIIAQEKLLDDSVQKLLKNKIGEFDTEDFIAKQEKELLKNVIDEYINAQTKEKLSQNLVQPLDVKFSSNVDRALRIIEYDLNTNGGDNSQKLLEELYRYLRNSGDRVQQLDIKGKLLEYFGQFQDQITKLKDEGYLTRNENNKLYDLLKLNQLTVETPKRTPVADVPKGFKLNPAEGATPQGSIMGDSSFPSFLSQVTDENLSEPSLTPFRFPPLSELSSQSSRLNSSSDGSQPNSSSSSGDSSQPPAPAVPASVAPSEAPTELIPASQQTYEYSEADKKDIQDKLLTEFNSNKKLKELSTSIYNETKDPNFNVTKPEGGYKNKSELVQSLLNQKGLPLVANILGMSFPHPSTFGKGFDKLKSSYPKQLYKYLSILTIKPYDAIFYGSQADKNILYPSDVDIFEILHNSTSKKRTIDNFVKKLKEITMNIENSKELFIGDIKCGLDNAYMIDIGDIKNGKINGYNPSEIKKQIEKNTYYSREEKEDLIKLVKQKPSIDDWLSLNEYIRLKVTLRWTPKEIISGQKLLPHNRIKTLEDAVSDSAIIKIDVIGLVNNRFIEITDLYKVHYHQIPLNKDVKLDEDLLKGNLIKQYHDKFYFKSLKRIYSLLKLKMKDKQMIKKLQDFFNSEYGMLYKFISQLKTIVTLIEFNSIKLKYVWDNILNNLDMSKSDVANIDKLKIDEKGLDKKIDSLSRLKNHSEDREKMVRELEKIVEVYMEIINKGAKSFMTKNNLYPLPKKYYP